MFNNQTITLTFCDQAENHVGMQKLGEFANEGFDLNDLLIARDWFEQHGVTTELIDLNYPIENLKIYPNDEAYILIARHGVDSVVGPQYNSMDFFNEQINLDWDSKALMYGRVVNKHARHNLCFGHNDQEADYENGHGTIVSFDSVPILNRFRKMLPKIIGEKGKNLVAEGNYYYDVNKCGIGFHGDSERLKVIGVRLGETIPLEYQWFCNSKPVGERISLELNHGDIYFMSEKCTGNDWRCGSIYTLRHAAGCQNFLTIK